jgi:quercetin dioxygenase-like cupin family protein
MRPSSIAGRQWKLVDLVAYQEGAVVSRTILEKETGTVTLFAFDKGQNLSEHTVPYDALVYILDGRGRINISGEPYDLKAGDLLLMPGGEPHEVRASERFKMMLTMIRV